MGGGNAGNAGFTPDRLASVQVSPSRSAAGGGQSSPLPIGPLEFELLLFELSVQMVKIPALRRIA